MRVPRRQCCSNRTEQPHRKAAIWPTRLGILVLLPFLLGILSACNLPGSTNGSSSSGTRTPPPGQSAGEPTPTIGAAIASPTPVPTATAASGAFQATFQEQYSAAPCTGPSSSGSTCVTTTGTGQAGGFGGVALSRTSVYSSPGSDSCGPATTAGTLILSTGDTITFHGPGTFCRATQVANFTYSITGGTGAYARATGSGSIHVPLPSSSSSGTETWTGTILTS
jgi:hypothetical protein